MHRLTTLLFGMTLAANATMAMAENPANTVTGDSVAKSVSMFYPTPDMTGVGGAKSYGMTSVANGNLPGAQVTVPQKVSRKTEAAAVATGLLIEGVAKELNPDIMTPHDRVTAPPFGVAR